MSNNTISPTTLDARVIYTNKYSGGRTVELSHEAERVVREALRLGYTVDPRGTKVFDYGQR